MNVIGHRFNPAGETLWMRGQITTLIARALPAIVDIDVLVTFILHTRCHHRIGHFFDERFTHVTTKSAPTVPAQAWGLTDGIFLRRKFALSFKLCTRTHPHQDTWR